MPKRKIIAIVLVVAVVIAVIIITIVGFFVVNSVSRAPVAPSVAPISNPALNVNWSISPQGIINASQGTTEEINLTFTSILDNQQTLIPIENLTLTYYQSKIDYANWGTNNSLNFPQDRFFNYSFSQTQLTVQPLASNSTTLTIKIADDAPLGMYSFNINLGNITGNPESQTAYISLAMVVAPKIT